MSETADPRPQAASKYNVENLLAALRLFIKARNKAIKSGFTDNGGAIHSVERILDILAPAHPLPSLAPHQQPEERPDRRDQCRCV